MIDDAMAFQHWPWPLAELDTHQRTAIKRGVAGHCTAAATAAAAEVHLREGLVNGLEARQSEIAAASGHAEGDPLLLCNCAAALANETRLLAAARAKLARLGA